MVLCFCQGKPTPPFEVVRAFIRPLVNLLRNCEASEPDERKVMASFRIDAVWALCKISDEGRIQALTDSHVVPLFVNYIKRYRGSQELLIPVIRTLGNIATGNDEQTQTLIDAGFLKCTSMLLTNISVRVKERAPLNFVRTGILISHMYFTLLSSCLFPQQEIRKETCWILSNIAVGTHEQIAALFKAERQGALMERVVLFAVNSHYQERKEAVWTLCNVVLSGKDILIQSLVQVDGIRGLCAGLEIREPKLLLTLLNAFEKLMAVDEAYDRNYRLIMEEYGGIERLEGLQLHPNDDVYEKSNHLIKRFFPMKEVDENIVPVEEDGASRCGLSFKDNSPIGAPSPSTTYGDRLLMNPNTH